MVEEPNERRLMSAGSSASRRKQKQVKCHRCALEVHVC